MSVNLLENDLQSLEAVHCLVHPGYDAGEHTAFEATLHDYVDSVAKRANDILIIVSDGESFDDEQLRQFQLLNIIEGIAYFISLHIKISGLHIQVYDTNGRYNRELISKGLDEYFYKWCRENIDMSEIMKIENEWKKLRESYSAGKFDGRMSVHNAQAQKLDKRSKQVRIEMDIAGLAQKAMRDLRSFRPMRSHTHRALGNRGRFIRLYQHAVRVFGGRVGEMFIADREDEDVSIQPITHFISSEGEWVPTACISDDSSLKGQIYHASEAHIFGNATKLTDTITYELSISRNRKLESQNMCDIAASMGFRITPDTEFLFFGEYRGRCVNTVARVLHARLRGIAGNRFHIMPERFTLQREDDRIGELGEVT